jgi:hypothetical protein
MGDGMIEASFDTLCRDFPGETQGTASRRACVPGQIRTLYCKIKFRLISQSRNKKRKASNDNRWNNSHTRKRKPITTKIPYEVHWTFSNA